MPREIIYGFGILKKAAAQANRVLVPQRMTEEKLEQVHEGIVKTGRTHLQDAAPIAFSQEISEWRASLERDKALLQMSLDPLRELALGGTALGYLSPQEFDEIFHPEQMV